MEVRKIVNGVLALKKLSAQELDFATTLKIVRNGQEFDNVLKAFDTKRTSITGNYPDLTKLTEEENQLILKELNDILDEEVEVTFEKLKIEELQDVKLSGDELTSILWLIDEE